ncbi:MAG: AbrB/MazE/SpoVT family DNA-binding domain-containing protein [Lachnospiraceae bacterium]|nr:AbrB/MazE/SpoVT family DNA-binding domain-containing protein [Lachnospiraceae bacterium]
MDLAKVTSRGQITIPIEIRKHLGIKDGDKVLFTFVGNNVVMTNASVEALHEAQNAFAGEAERLGLKSEDDVVDLVKQARAERSSDYQCV